MSVFEVPEWWGDIDQEAALTELHPRHDEIRHEKPGTLPDRVMRFEHENAKARRRHAPDWVAQVIADEADADRFIEDMEWRSARARKESA